MSPKVNLKNKNKDHIHKYYRVELTNIKKVKDLDGSHHIERSPSQVIFRCGEPGCAHYKPRVLVIGLESICWNCGESLILNMENTRLKKPTHRYCRKKKAVSV